MTLWVETTDPVELRPNATEAELQIVIRAAYRQVFGNQHILDSQGLANAESLLHDGNISVRGFVRMLAQSDLYRTLFFESSSSYRFVELNFKHLLGRAPVDQTEIAEHVLTYNTQGYEADINSYVDSDEYLASFGENVVPYYRGSQTLTGIKNVGFNRLFTLARGYASNDSGRPSALTSDVAGNLPTKIEAPASPIGSGAYSNTGKRFLISVAKVDFGPRVARSCNTFEVSYAQMSQQIQNIQRTGGKILSIAEVA